MFYIYNDKRICDRKLIAYSVFKDIHSSEKVRSLLFDLGGTIMLALMISESISNFDVIFVTLSCLEPICYFDVIVLTFAVFETISDFNVIFITLTGPEPICDFDIIVNFWNIRSGLQGSTGPNRDFYGIVRCSTLSGNVCPDDVDVNGVVGASSSVDICSDDVDVN
jgi:hypothetical protein